MSTFYIKLLVGVVVVLGIFGVLWKQGVLKRITDYVAATQEEMKKCNWPTWEELQQSTILIFVVIGMLGVFTMVVDFVILRIVRLLMGA